MQEWAPNPSGQLHLHRAVLPGAQGGNNKNSSTSGIYIKKLWEKKLKRRE